MGRKLISSLACAAALSTVACGDITAPTAERQTTRTAALTVRVLEYIDQVTPIPGVLVIVDGALAGTTAGNGELIVQVPVDTEIDVTVTSPHYAPAGAAATVRGPERWTFWLRE